MKASTLALAVGVAVIIVVAAAAVLLYGGRGNGTVILGVTDAPVSNVSHIYVTISNVALQAQGNTTISYKVDSTQFDLLSLTNVTKILGSNSIEAVNYTMIRFTVTSAVATISGSNVTLTVPSGEVKVPVHFQVKSGETTKIVLDITADMTNISAAHNLRPVVTIKSLTGPS